MTAKNDITGDSIMSKVSNDKFRDGYAAIFDRAKCKQCGKALFEDHIHTCTPKETHD